MCGHSGEQKAEGEGTDGGEPPPPPGAGPPLFTQLNS